MKKEDPKNKPDPKEEDALVDIPFVFDDEDEDKEEEDNADIVVFTFEDEEDEIADLDALYDQEELRRRATTLPQTPQTQKALSLIENLLPLNLITAEVLREEYSVVTDAQSEALDIMIAATLVAGVDNEDGIVAQMDPRVDALRQEFMLLYTAETQDERITIMTNHFSSAAKRIMLASLAAECEEIRHLVITDRADPLAEEDLATFSTLIIKASKMPGTNPRFVARAVEAFNSMCLMSGSAATITRDADNNLAYRPGYGGGFTPPSL